jgi:hypothetical protein
MTAPYFFGYGSLVNTATHSYGGARTARLRGWRRAWVHTDLSDVAILSAVPCDASEIDGLIAEVPGADWAALDAREFAYERLAAADRVTHDLDGAPDVSVYAVPAAHHRKAAQKHPILLSYLDVVLQGYLQQFGEAGVQGFIATTDGWDAPILDDRAAPRYPRHQPIAAAERALFDKLVDRTGARRIALEA